MTTFYKLTPEEIIAMDDLSKSEMRVLLYMRSCAPFPDCKVEFEAKIVAQELGIDRSTVSKAWKKLDRLGYIHFDIKAISASVVPFSLSQGSGRNRPLVGETAQISAKPPTSGRNGTDRSPKPSPSKASTTLQINKTNKIIQKREREANFLKFLASTPRFRDFCIRKSQELPDRPVLIESWICSNFEELKGLWERSQDSGVDQSSAARQGSLSAPQLPEDSAQKSPRVDEAIAGGELRQDPLFPDAVFDKLGNWWKKEDWEKENGEREDWEKETAQEPTIQGRRSRGSD